MATIERYEDIRGWQRARELTNFVYAITKQKAFARDFGLRDQIRRAAVSIMSNIAEGFERGGRAEFVQFLSIAKSSAGEVQSQLYVALDQEYIAPEQFDKGYKLCDETMRLIGGFIAYLRKSPIKGTKYKTRNSKLETLNPNGEV
jgi:four helix bundle protein